FLVQVNVELLGDIYTFFTDGHLGQALRGTAIALGGFVVVCLVIWLASGIWWRRLGFKLDDEEISLRRGVLSKSLRSARYDRTQAVDVVEDLIARMFGLASVRLETACGRTLLIETAYLKQSAAEKPRLEGAAHVHGVVDEPGEPAEAPDAEPHRPAAQHPDIIPAIPIRRSLAAAGLRVMTI